MKINRLETHDRFKHLIKDQSANVFKGAEDCMKLNSLSLAIQDKSPYVYLFAHPRTDTENGVSKVLYWDPRLSIPKPQTNSYLFRAQSKTDIIEIIWFIPPRELWPEYEKGKMLYNETIEYSINMFNTNRKHLEKSHPEDLSEEKGRLILKSIIDAHIQELRAKKSNKYVKI